MEQGSESDDSDAERKHQLLEPKHKVFLSHSGAQKDFVEQLCVDLERCDRYPFFDIRRDSLPIGENFPKLIFQAIRQCQVGVVILSNEFFERSKWPMLELVAMVKKKNIQDSNFMIIPVFLNISRMECCNRENHMRWLSIWCRWAKLDNRINVQEWVMALETFGHTNGLFYQEGLSKVKFREEIVEAICKLVHHETRMDDTYIQGRSRICKVIHQRIKTTKVSETGVCIIGIYGVGGIGKTTICKALSNEYFTKFHGKVCHLEFEDGNDLKLLQEALRSLTDIRHDVLAGFNIDECRDQFNRNINKQKAFLALDNISDTTKSINQARTFIRAGYGKDSILIVTARSLDQLLNLNLRKTDCIEMPELLEDEARSLFLYYAIIGNQVDEKSIKRCIQRCYFRKGHGITYHYHPLSLRVLGAQLGCDSEQWMPKLSEPDVFNQFREQEHPVFSILRKSFDALIDEDQVLFMDVALMCPEYSLGCKRLYIDNFQWLSMMHGKSVENVKARLQDLKRKSLVQSLGDGKTRFGIHDLWREFCVMETKGGKLESRRWVYEEVHDPNNMHSEESNLCSGGWKKLRKIFLTGKCSADCKVILNLSCCSNLTMLKMVNVFVEDNVLDLNVLKNLKCLEISFTTEKMSLPFDSKRLEPRGRSGIDILGLGLLKHLVVLKWDGIPSNSPRIEEISNLISLRVVLLTSYLSKNKLPDVSRLGLLQYAAFREHDEAVTISGLSSRLSHLQYLDLGGSRSLRRCHGVGDLVALEELRLAKCDYLEELPNLQKLTKLQKLDISGSTMITVLRGVGELVALLELRAFRCYGLAELPGMHKLTNLQVLNLDSCPINKEVGGLGELINLHQLSIHINGIGDSTDLPKLTKLRRIKVMGWSSHGSPGVASLVNLETLHIYRCTSVDKLAGLSQMTRLHSLTIDRSEFNDVSCLSNLTQLLRVNIGFCNVLERFPDMHKVTNLEMIQITSCENLREWEGVSGSRLRLLETFEVDLQSHGALPQALPKLQTLICYKVAFTELPDLFNFPQLRLLRLLHCEDLTSLTNIAPLTAIQSLELIACRSLELLPDLRGSTRLRSVEVVNCGVQLKALEIETLKAMCPRIRIQR